MYTEKVTTYLDVTKIVALVLAGVMMLGVFVSHTLASANEQQEKSSFPRVVSNDISEGVRLVSLHLEEESLNSALKQLARKANVGFSFNPEIIPDKSISVNFESITVHEALSRLLEGTGLEVKLPPTRDVIVIKEKPQKGNEVTSVLQATVTGTVTDAQTGDPLPGANVSIQGTTTGSSADSEGQYSISGVEPGTYTFVASFIGYQESTQEVTVGQNQQQLTVDFSLQPSQLQMEEMVVTALGVQQESRSLTSSVGQVQGESVAQSQDINVANSLAGRVSGVQVQSAGSGPGGSSRVVIRGFSSLGGNNQPLYVVDGVPIDNTNRGSAGRWGGYDRGDGIQNINPQDIEDISVLKGPSAASLYGQRGANGVVLITTKSGQAQEGIGVELNSSVTVGSPMVWPNWQNEYGLGNNGQHRFFRDGSGNIRSRSEWQDAGQPDWTPQITTAADGPQHPKSWGPRMDGSQVYNWDGTTTSFSPQPNNAKDYFEEQFTVDNTLSFSGGNESTTFRLSLQDMRNQSMLPTHELTKQGINLRASHQVSDRLTAEGKVNYIRQEAYNRPALSDDQENVMYQFRGMPRNTQLSNLTDYTIGADEQLVGYSSDINQEGFPRHWSNATHTEQPYWIVNNIINEDTRERVMGFVRINYDLTDWLSAQVRAETDFYVDKWHNHAAIGTRTPGQGDGTLGDQVHRFREDNAEFLLTGEQSVTDNLTITANIGGNYKRDFFNNTNFSGEQLAVENLYVISNAQIQNTGYDLQETEIQSLYAFGQFNWRDFWYVDWSVRNDWASTLPSDDNSFAYPSIGTNFIFTDAFDIESDILSYGSVRANWAQAGSSADPYQLSGTYGLVANPHQGQPGAEFQNNIPFIDLQNELTTSVEVGADLRFFEGRLRVDGNWYSNSTVNQILNIPVSTASGYFSRSVNAGEITNSGIELMVEGTPVSTEDLQWDITVNYGRNNNEVVELVEGIDRFRLGDARNVAVYADPGQPYGSIYTTTARYVRDENGNRLIDQSGLPIRESGEFQIGNAMPEWNGGISNTISYRGWMLSAMIDMQWGGDIYSVSNTYEAIYGTTEATLEGRGGGYVAEGVAAEPDGNGGWTSTGQPNTVEVSAFDYWNRVAPSEGNVVTEEFLTDGTYIKMRELSLAYNFPVSVTGAIGINRLRLSVIGKNLFYFFKHSDGWSPESHNRNVGTSSLGMEDMSWPSIRSVGFTLNVGL